MEFDDIRVSEDGGVATITIDVPPANVVSTTTIEELERAFEQLDDDERRAIVVTGGGDRMFSGGVEVEDHLGDQLPEMIETFGGLFETMRSLGTPTIASVGGPALGGGCEIVAGCDLAVASEDARFGQPEIDLGSFPPIAAAMFPAMLGEKRAFELVLTGREVDAATAADLGLVNDVVPPEDLEAATEELAGELAAKSGLVLGMAKRAFYDTAAQPSFEQALDVANDHAVEITSTEEGQEGLHAFMEDREPDWTY